MGFQNDGKIATHTRFGKQRCIMMHHVDSERDGSVFWHSVTSVCWLRVSDFPFTPDLPNQFSDPFFDGKTSPRRMSVSVGSARL